MPQPLGGRLHPAFIILQPLGQLVPLAAVALFGLVTRGTASVDLLVILAVGMVIAAAVRWSVLRWELTDDALIINQGVVRRQQRVIPLSRIHTVDLSRPLWHRVLGVVEVAVETVGGGQTEGKLEALDPQTAAALRRRLLGSGDEEAAADRSPPLAAVGPGMLVAAGLTGGRVGVAAALVGFAQQIAGDRIPDALAALRTSGIGTVLVLAAIVLLVSFVLSVMATAVTFWGFELRREGDDLTVRRGLLDKRLDTVPVARIQAVVVQENLVRQMLGLASVQVVVAGRAGGETATQQAVVLPLGRRAQAMEVAQAIMGADAPVGAALRPAPRAALWRRVRRGVLMTAAVTGAAMALFGASGGWAAVTAVIWVPLGIAGYRSLGHMRDATFVISRHGALVRTTTVVPVGKVQSRAVAQTLFQRRLDLATVELHVAATARSSIVAVIDLDADGAARWLGAPAAHLADLAQMRTGSAN